MNARSTSLRVKVESTALAPRPRNGGGGTAGGSGPGGWKLALESRWQRKIDEVVILSQARSGLSGEPDETVAAPGDRRSRRLGARIDAALGEVAAIEEALARLDDGSYGTCAGCDRPMTAEWLADSPETRYCPDCSLRLVSWRPPSKRKVKAGREADTPGASAEAQQAAPQIPERNRRQVRPTDSDVQALGAVAGRTVT
jgi:RNA polymerase-binding transcription factor DksA